MPPFPFELVSPARLVFGGEVESVVVPGTEGEFEVMRDHAPFMSTIRPGILVVNEGGGVSRRLFVRGGFADVSPAGLTILAEQAVPVEEVRPETIAAEIKNAEEDVADAMSDEARRRAQERLDQLREIRTALGI